MPQITVVHPVLGRRRTLPRGEAARYLAAGWQRLDPPAEQTEPDPVPAGTIAEIVEWVAGEPPRALAALEHEKTHQNRKTLIEALEAITDPGDGEKEQTS